MKQGFYRLYKATLFLAIALFFLSGKSITTRAIEYDKVFEIGMLDKNECGPSNKLGVRFDTPDDHISNVRTNSKYLKAVNIDYWTEKTRNNYENIQLYAKKMGSYWLYFDVVDNAGNFKSTHKVKVIAYSKRDRYKAFKSIKIGKVNILNRLFKDDYTTKAVTLKKGGKIKVKMNKGCKLVDISVRRNIAYDEPSPYPKYFKYNDKSVEESIQNGSILRLSEVGEDYKFYQRESYQERRYNDSIFGYTYLTLTYRDKEGFERRKHITIRSRLK